MSTFPQNLKELDAVLRRLRPMPIKVRATTIQRVLKDARAINGHALEQARSSTQLRAFAKPLVSVDNTLASIQHGLGDDEFTQAMFQKAVDMALKRLADLYGVVGDQGEPTKEATTELLAGHLDDIRKTVHLPTHTNLAFIVQRAPIVPILQNREFSFDEEFKALRIKTQRVEQYNVLLDQMVLGFDRARAADSIGTGIKLPRISKKMMKQIEEAGFGTYEPTYEGLLSFVESNKPSAVAKNKRVSELLRPLYEQARALADKIKSVKDDANLDDTYVQYAHNTLKYINERNPSTPLALMCEHFVRGKSGNLVFFWIAPARTVNKILAKPMMRPVSWAFP